MSTITIDIVEKKCIGCDECFLSCHAEVFKMVDKKAKVVRLEECVICDTCVLICPTDAINITQN